MRKNLAERTQFFNSPPTAARHSGGALRPNPMYFGVRTATMRGSDRDGGRRYFMEQVSYTHGAGAVRLTETSDSAPAGVGWMTI